MKRIAFKMKLKPGFKDEYKKRHDQIWPDLKKLLKENGISNYSIFYDEETDFLFAFQHQSGNTFSQDLGDNPVVQKWWDHMADLMEINSNNSPVAKDLEELFFLK
jgi:L-rhamnose mutarotase